MRKLLRSASDAGAADLFLRLTLIDFLLRPTGPWVIRPLILILSGVGLTSSAVLRAPLTWLILFILLGIRIVLDWPSPDNHKYLLAYWCLSIGLGLRSIKIRETLALASRLLLGLAFALATIWKGFLSPDYMDGRFFRVTLLTDNRFTEKVMLLTGMTGEQIDQNRIYLQPLQEGETWFDPPVLYEPPVFRSLATFATYATLAAEAIIAVLFLLPGQKRGLQVARHISLLGFCVLTYSVAPVAGFGWLLLVMGLAQCRPDQRFLQYLYVIVYFLVLLYAEVPWANLLLEAQDT